MKIFTFKRLLTGLLLLYTVVGFFLLPFLITSKAPSLIEDATGAHFKIKDASFNPFVFELKLKGLTFNDPDNQKFAALKQIKVNIDPSALFLGKIQIDTIELTQPDLNIIQKEQGVFNFNWLLAASEEKEAPQSNQQSTGLADLPRIVIKNISIIDGEIAYSDLTRPTPFNTKIGPIGFSLKDLDTKDINNSNNGVRLHLGLFDGGFLDIKSEFLSLEPLAVQGSVDFEAGKLYTPWQYLQDDIKMEVADGQLHLHLNYLFDAADINATRIDNIRFVLEKLRIKPKAEHDDLLRVGLLTLNGGVVEPLKNNIELDDISLDNVMINIKRDQQKQINWIKAVRSEEKTATPEEPLSKDKKEDKDPWNLMLHNFKISGSKIVFADRAVSPHTATLIDDIQFHAKEISSKAGSILDYNASLRINKRGHLATSGSLRHTPLKTHSDIKITQFDLKDFNAYLAETTYLGIERGSLGLNSSIFYEDSQPSPLLKAKGSLTVNDFVLQDTHDKSLLAAWQELSIKPFVFKGAANDLLIDEIMLDSFYVNAIVDRNQSLNFAQLVKEDNASSQTVSAEQNLSKTEPFGLRIVKFTINNSNANFADFSLPLQFQTSIHDINGTVYGISNQPEQTSYIDINGAVDRYGSAKIEGSLNSANPKSYTNIALEFRNLDLNSVSPYSGKFIGRKIDAGKLFVALDYDLLNSQMQGDNTLIIKKLSLGENVESNDSTPLPLDLAIALLEDSDGVIDIDMPVEGDVDNPDFKWGSAAWGAFTNLITKAVTAPFSLLGSMLGIDGEQLEYVEFEPAEETILPPEKEKLDLLAKALKKRPKLGLKITGTYDRELDGYALKKKKIIALVMEHGKEKKANTKKAMTLDSLEKLHKEQLPKQSLKTIKKETEEKHKNQTEFLIAYQERLVSNLIQKQTIKEDELLSLAARRAEKITHYLHLNHEIKKERINALPGKESEKKDQKWVRSSLAIEAAKQKN